CVAPHPSTMAAALLAYEAKVTTDRRSSLTIGDLLGDGSHGSGHHSLPAGAMIKSIELASPLQGERALYKRAISRTHAEWPLVELCVRAVIANGKFHFIRIAAGGIAPVPLRLSDVEAVIDGLATTPAAIADAAKKATSGA